jgi:hypothetical protein
MLPSDYSDTQKPVDLVSCTFGFVIGHLSKLLLPWPMSHPVLEGKPNANHVRARIRTHVHSTYIIGHHHRMLEINSGKVLYYIKMSETST